MNPGVDVPDAEFLPKLEMTQASLQQSADLETVTEFSFSFRYTLVGKTTCGNGTDQIIFHVSPPDFFLIVG